jgi:hypothetical protein
MEEGMRKIIVASGLAILMGTPLGYGAVADDAIQAGQVRASKIIGSAVYDGQNRNIASVKDLILDKDGKVANVVLSFGSTAGIGGKYVAVPYNGLKFINNRLTTDQTKEQLASMPAYRIESRTTGSREGAVPTTGGYATNPTAPPPLSSVPPPLPPSPKQ